jgi:ketosteroid isomerase-like protein
MQTPPPPTRGDAPAPSRDLAQLLDKHALHELVVRYCRAVDRADLELLLSCYHHDAVDEHGTFSGPPAEVFPAVLERLRNEPPTQHALSNELFWLDGDVAYGETYNELRTLGSDGAFHQGGFGRYLDRFEQRDGEWRIAHRTAVIEYMPPRPGRDASGVISGSKDREDPSYRRDGSPRHQG